MRALAATQSPSVLLNLITVFLEATGPMTRVFPPRLVLEYSALKAARIRHLLPVEDLLAACEGAEMPTRVAAPAAAPAAPPAAPAEGHASLTESWRRVLAHLAKSDRVLHAHVAAARPISFARGELRLGFPASHKTSAQKVNEPRRRAELEKAASDAFGEAVAVRADVEEGVSAPAAAEGVLFHDSSLAAEVKKKYGGEVVEEKDNAAPDAEAV